MRLGVCGSHTVVRNYRHAVSLAIPNIHRVFRLLLCSKSAGLLCMSLSPQVPPYAYSITLAVPPLSYDFRVS